VLLPPTVSCRAERVVAGKTRKFGVLGPNIFFVVALAFCTPSEALHRCAKLHGLTCAPIAHADPRRIFHRFARFGFERLFPMARHDGGKGIEFEIKIGMTGGDHFVVNKFVFRAEMAFKTFFGAINDVARFMHAEFDGFFVRPTGCGVRAEPTGSRAVTVFAGNAFSDFEFAALLFGFGVKRVALETLGSLFGFCAQFQNAGHAFADVTRESLIGAAVLIFQNPGGVFGLENAASGDGFDAAVATGGGAGAGPDIFHRFRSGGFIVCA